MLIVCCTAVPALLVGAVWVDSKVGNQCVINKKGMIRIFGTKGTLYPWKEIETYRFVDYMHVPNVRDLIIVVHQRNRQFERHLRFYPHEVDENELEELLREYLFRNH